VKINWKPKDPDFAWKPSFSRNVLRTQCSWRRGIFRRRQVCRLFTIESRDYFFRGAIKVSHAHYLVHGTVVSRWPLWPRWRQNVKKAMSTSKMSNKTSQSIFWPHPFILLLIIILLVVCKGTPISDGGILLGAILKSTFCRVAFWKSSIKRSTKNWIHSTACM
jgi:hypothetical protein